MKDLNLRHAKSQLNIIDWAIDAINEFTADDWQGNFPDETQVQIQIKDGIVSLPDFCIEEILDRIENQLLDMAEEDPDADFFAVKRVVNALAVKLRNL